MPLNIEIKRQFSALSERTKCIDIHPKEPWVLSALYSGHLFIWNYITSQMVKSFEVCDLPVRAAKFIPRMQWIICASDDMKIRVFNYNTMEKCKEFDAHSDYIRCLAIHPTRPLVLSSSDDMSIKMWNWEQNWENVRIFDGHTHYVMQIEINPKDPNTFASASLDRTIKVWGINNSYANLTLEGHERGVNCVSYFHGGEKPYLVSGADDHTVKVWDYQTKRCVATLTGHSHNISAVAFHPQLPVILSGSEDGTLRIWHAATYREERLLNYSMERIWAVYCLPNSSKVAIGYDEGTVLVSMGSEEPIASMDRTGRVVWANGHEIITANMKTVNEKDLADGEPVHVVNKDMGNSEIFPQWMQHSPNGRLLAVSGDGEFIVYTARALKHNIFGNALEFVWGTTESGLCATRSTGNKITIYKNLKEHHVACPPFPCEGLFGGSLLAIRSTEFIDFYDWDHFSIIRRIEIVPKHVFWSENGDFCVLADESSYFVLHYNADTVSKYFSEDVEVGDQGIETAFDLEEEINEKVQTGCFVGDCFLYCNAGGRLNYYVGGEVITLAHLEKPLHLLGYFQPLNRVFLIDKLHIYSYELLLSLLVYQTAIVRRDFETAKQVLPSIPRNQLARLARFLEGQGLRDLALEVTPDPEHKFELALQLGQLKVAHEIAAQSETEQKWKQLGDQALEKFDLDLASECFWHGEDISALLLMFSCSGNQKQLEKLATVAKEKGQFNVAFVCLFLLHRLEECITLLCDTGRIPEAAFFARTYLPSAVSRVVELWRKDLSSVSTRAADSLGDPSVFPEMKLAVQAEKWIYGSDPASASSTTVLPSARSLHQIKERLSIDYLQVGRDNAFDSLLHLFPEKSELHTDDVIITPANVPAVDNDVEHTDDAIITPAVVPVPHDDVEELMAGITLDEKVDVVTDNADNSILEELGVLDSNNEEETEEEEDDEDESEEESDDDDDEESESDV